jgi:asparagine synthase (glutamine-hydrolysing)
MCGIAGIVDLQRRALDPGAVRGMVASLGHRGPDGEGTAQPAPWVLLGHRRLAIIDLCTGDQPLANEDRRVWTVFNGEIFNYRELREELARRGHRLATTSDTEVLVHLFEEHGPELVQRLNGQFAFAVWDGRRLFAARDAFGIKPFYYYLDDERFAFASEPRALLAMPGVDAELDPRALGLYFRYRFIPAPLSAWKRIRKLRCGESLVLEDGRVSVRRWWDLAQCEVEDLSDLDTAKTLVRETLEQAVERQRIADVPVGAFLSGGIDSSTIVALMSRHVPERLRTFTIGFAPPGNDERPYARRVAEAVGSEHHEHLIEATEVQRLIPFVLDHVDEPFGDASLIPTYAVSKLARESAKVALSGDGGDELFAGYGRYYRALAVLSVPPVLRPLWRVTRKLFAATRDPRDWRYADGPDVDRAYHRLLTRTSDGERQRLYGPALVESDADGSADDPVAEEFQRFRKFPPLARLLAVDFHTLLAEYYLVKVDRASMAASLEVRPPFLDLDFVRLAFRLRPELRCHGARSKGLLREVMRGDIPDSVADRGVKTGFGLPLARWFAGDLAPFVKERLADSIAVRDGWLSRPAVDMCLAPRASGKVDGSLIWRLLVFESWLRGQRARVTA